MKITLDKRLSAIYNEIFQCKTLADIGCDHGKLLIKAVCDMRCERAIAADISHSSISKAIKTATEYGVDSSIKFVVSDGFSSLTDEFDCAVISGLGGFEIVAILQKNEKQDKRLVLSPNKNTDALRSHLLKNNYVIVEDYIVCCNGYYYDIIVCDSTRTPISYDEYSIEFGKYTKNQTDYISYLDKTIARMSDFSVKLTEDEKDVVDKKIAYLTRLKNDFVKIDG